MLNRHKIKRQLKRKRHVERVKKNTAYYGLKRKDFAWKGKSGNPITSPSTSTLLFRTKVEISLLFIVFLSFLGVLIYHPFFHFSNIIISGTERLAPNDIADAVKGSMEYKKLMIFPANNYFFVDTDEIQSILNDRFPLNSVTIQKTFPHTLDIHVDERLSTIIFDNGHTYYFMGLTGKIVEPIRNVTPAEWVIETEYVTSTNELGEEIQDVREIARYHTPDTAGLFKDVGVYPLMFRDVPTAIESFDITTEIVPESYIASLIEWYDHLQNKSQFSPQYMDITSPHETVYYTRGLDVYMSIVGESGEQIERFETALRQIENPSLISYIDVRYVGRAYWK